MPCYSEYPSERDTRQSSEIDKLTRMLCSTLRLLDHRQVEMLNPETKRWWNKHQAWDKKRLAREAEAAKRLEAKKRGLKKLTDYERKALGLD